MPGYIGFSNETLGKRPRVKKGDTFRCPRCGEEHVLVAGTDSRTGEEVDIVLFYRCGDDWYLGALNGHLVVDVPPDVSGELDI